VTHVPCLTLPGVSERELLNGFLDWYRAVVENKVRDLSIEDASRIMTPTGLSPLGIVKHLAFVERGWFKARFAAEEQKVDPDTVFRIEPGDSVASVLAFYRGSVTESRRIAAGASLDAISKSESPTYGYVSMRWILVHMLEETARHAGHLDLMREQIDGKTGD
jgi:hypothetical protein